MNLKDILWLSYKDLSEKRVRTTLTVIMVVIGVASIVALISQTAGISASIQSALSTLGPTSIILMSSRPTGFSVIDTSQLSTLPNVSAVVPIVSGSAYALANGQNVSVTVIGVSTAGLHQLIGNTSLYSGVLYQDALSPSTVIGYDVAFPTSMQGQQNIKVGQPMTLHFFGKSGLASTVPVSGIINPFGTSIIPVDTAAMMSLPEAQALLQRNSYNIILVKASNTSSVTPLSNLITNIYGSNARVITTQQLLQTTATIIGSITLLLGVIAGISLVVAAIGIMNIMLIAVYERTHEIGIMKSLGFKRKHILMIFLTQALLIGMIGGVVGIATGVGASYSLSAIISSASSQPSANATANSGATGRGGGVALRGGPGGGQTFIGGGGGGGPSSTSYSPVFSLGTMLAALLVAMLVSVIAGIYPAWRASQMEPIDALRQL